MLCIFLDFFTNFSGMNVRELLRPVNVPSLSIGISKSRVFASIQVQAMSSIIIQ